MANEQATQEPKELYAKISNPINESDFADNEVKILFSRTVSEITSRVKDVGMSNVWMVTDPVPTDIARDGGQRRGIGIQLEKGFLQTELGRSYYDTYIGQLADSIVETCKKCIEDTPGCVGLVLSTLDGDWTEDSAESVHLLSLTYYTFHILARPQIVDTPEI